MKQIDFGNGQIIRQGKTYVGNNGVSFTVEGIFRGDRYNMDRVDYRLADGRSGGTTHSSMYHWIDWTRAA
jgi:hypothetical protein